MSYVNRYDGFDVFILPEGLFLVCNIAGDWLAKGTDLELTLKTAADIIV
jgi:hypothetical protein